MVNSFLYAVYCKPTFTGLFTNFENFLPIIYKKYTQLYYYFHISSSYSIFYDELEKLKIYLSKKDILPNF